jgi:hypothetical protein
MTTLEELLTNYTLEEEYNIAECPCLEINKYDVLLNGDDIIFQFTIYAEDVKEAFLIFHGARLRVVAKFTCPNWVICLKFPSIAIAAYYMSMRTHLELPDAVNVQRIVSLSKRFISKDRSFIGNEFLQASRQISFDLNGQTCIMYDQR